MACLVCVNTLLRECFAAETAGEAVILVMGADVSLHISLLGEAFATNTARKRLLFGVH